MSELTLDQAMKIVEVGFSHGRKTNCLPLGIAVLDPGGHLISFAREDGTSFLRPAIAQAKAWGALGMGMGSRALENRPDRFMMTLNSVSGGKTLNARGSYNTRSRGQNTWCGRSYWGCF